MNKMNEKQKNIWIFFSNEMPQGDKDLHGEETK